MTTLAQQSSGVSLVKGMFVGDSGTGKTGALYSLLKIGYRLFVLDFDNGLDIIVGMARADKTLTEPQRLELLGRVNYVTCQDMFMMAQGKPVCQAALGWPLAMKTLDSWPDKGKLSSFTSDDIFVLDSLTFGGKSALRFILSLNSRLTSQPWQQDFLQAQNLIENLLGLIYSNAVRCHTLILTHIRQQGIREQHLDSEHKVINVEVEGSRKGYPETGTGRALSPTVGRYFNTMLMMDIMGSGPSAMRVIRTVPHENIGLKNPAPGLVAPQYPIADGLAQIFAAIRGGARPSASSTIAAQGEK